jgi:ferritin
MRLPIEQLQQDHKFFTDAAKDAEKKGKMIEHIYQSQATIELAKIQANSTGVQALSQVQQHRLKYQSLKSKLLEAAKG